MNKTSTLKIGIIFCCAFTITIPTLHSLPQNDSNGELLSLQIIFRYGARTPLFVPPTDQYANYSWPNGLGALTLQGKEQMYRYGQVIRKRYGDYLEKIQPQNIIVKSSPVRRCIDSSVAFLHGLVPPTKEEIGLSEISFAKEWHPINVTTVNMLSNNFKCPSVDRWMANKSELLPIKLFINEKHQLLERFSKYSGYKIEPKWFGFITAHDTLYCEKYFFGKSFKWPDWMGKVGGDCWKRMTALRNSVHSLSDYLPEKYARLKVGSIFKDWFVNLNETINYKPSQKDRKVHVYATHDSVISVLLTALGLFREQASFGSGLIIELRKHMQTDQAQIHLLYSNVTNNYNIYPLALNTSNTFKSLCKYSFCDFNNFTNSLKLYLPNDVDKECNDLSGN